jgi:hypothetical protein
MTQGSDHMSWLAWDSLSIPLYSVSPKYTLCNSKFLHVNNSFIPVYFYISLAIPFNLINDTRRNMKNH